MFLPVSLRALSASLGLTLACVCVRAVDGVIPNRTYAPAEQFTAISPQLSSLHLNQPSVYNGYLILAGNAVHEVWDIADPYAPVLRSTFQSNFRSGEAESHQVTYSRRADGTGYMATISGRGVDIWNVTVTTAPTLVSQIQLPNINYGDVTGGIWGVAWHGKYLYAGATTHGLYVIDVSNPAAPAHVATLSRVALGNVPAGPLFPMGNTLVVTTPKTFAGVATVDISNPLQPRLLDSVIPTGGDSYIGGFYAGYATLITPFRAYDVTTDPANITLLGTTNTPYGEYTSFANNKMFFGGIRGGTHGVYKYDVTNPAAPVLEGRFVGRDTRWDDQFTCPIGNLIAVADDQQVDGRYVGGLIVVHDTQPDSTGPSVLKVFPADGSIGQPLSTCPTVSLSEWPELATVDATDFIVRPVGGAAIPGSWSTTTTLLTFGPDAPLLPSTLYEIVLPAGGVRDFVGNPIATGFRSTFRTGQGGVSGFPGNEAIAAVPPTELGQTTIFSLAATPAAATDYRWNFGNGQSATGPLVNHTYSGIGRYSVRLDIVPTGPRVDKFEAESAVLSGGVVSSPSNPGYTGTGMADFPGGTGTNVAVTWNLNLAAAAWVHLDFRYANGGTTARPLHLVVNGGTAIPLTFASTTAWNQYRMQPAPQAFYLPAGANTIVLRATNGSAGGNIDRLDLVHLQPEEAEDADLSAGISVRNWHPGFTGTGFADYDATGADVRIRWTLDLASPLTLPLNFRYANGGTGDRPLNLVINNGTPVALPFPATGSWTTYATQASSVLTFAAGTHTIDLVCSVPGSGGGNIDSLLLPALALPPSSISFTHIVHRPLTPTRPSASRPLELSADGATLWVCNPDADTVTRLDAATLAKLGEHPVGDQPENLALASDGRVWVVNHAAATLTILAADGSFSGFVSLPRGSRPYGLVFSPDGTRAHLSLQAAGRILTLDTASLATVAALDLPADADGCRPEPRGLALAHDGARLYATRFISPDAGGQVYEIDTSATAPGGLALLRTLALAAATGPDTSVHARGIPNYLVNTALTPDGGALWLPSKQDNIFRGGLRDGLPLGHDVTVRAVTSLVDLATGAPRAPGRIDHDNFDRAHAVDFSLLGDLAFVTLPGNHRVLVLDAATGGELTELPTGNTPTGVLFDPTRGRLFTLDFLGRTVSGFDVTALLTGTGAGAPPLAAPASTVATEPLSPEVLQGKRLFYDAASMSLNMEGYMSCASCHLDGGHDGRVWDFTHLGEGLRNTIDLRGRAGTAHGPLHWSANFDEVQDFEGQIRDLGQGEGLMNDADFHAGTRARSLGDRKAGRSQELDALAAYVASLATYPESPHRAEGGGLTAEGLRGRALFNRLACYACHGGQHFTDSPLALRHDVGTLKTSSGARLGGALDGLDTPTLRGAWASPPYGHDGATPTLEAWVARMASDGAGRHGRVSELGAGERSDLVAYLRQIDGREPAALAATGKGLPSLAKHLAAHGAAGGAADDPDGDGAANLLEYAIGASDPANPAATPETPSFMMVPPTGGAQGGPAFVFAVRAGAAWTGATARSAELIYRAAGSTDLVSWTVVPVSAPVPSGWPAPPAGHEWACFTLPPEMMAGGRGFLRVEISTAQ
jgi:cytochrome c peroxidase